jgi:phosphatidylglycerophosphate synthase
MTHALDKIGQLRARAQRRGGSLYDRLFTRRVSIFVTAALYPFGVAPNAVSFANTLVGLTGWFLVGSNTYPLIGVLLVHLWAVLDSVDGELARLTRRFSLKGLFLEDHSAYLMINGYWLAMGFYLWRTNGTLWLLLACVALVAFGRQAMPASRRALIKSIETGRPLDKRGYDTAAEPRELAGGARFVFIDLLHPTTMWAVTTTVLVIERLWVGSHIGLLTIASGYLALSAVKELAILLRFLTTDSLDRWLSHLYLKASEVPQGEIDPFALAGDAPQSGTMAK